MDVSDNLLGVLENQVLECDQTNYGDVDAINAKWDERAEQDDLEPWEWSDYDFDTEFGVEDVEDVMQVFDDDGFDTNGFDRNGLNEEGVHFNRTGLIYEMDDDENELALERMIVEEVKQCMNGLFWEEKLSGVQAELKMLRPGWEVQNRSPPPNSIAKYQGPVKV